jgi:hypothetical protein
MKVSIGDEVRVHYHPPALTKSFAEGVVSRVDVTTLRGRVFVVDVTYDVVHDREQPIKPGYRNYVLYERWEDFPGRIEMLSQVERDPGPEPEANPEADREVARDSVSEPELAPEAQHQDSRGLGNVIEALFGRRS